MRRRLGRRRVHHRRGIRDETDTGTTSSVFRAALSIPNSD
jgi:hypothetical protein